MAAHRSLRTEEFGVISIPSYRTTFSSYMAASDSTRYVQSSILPEEPLKRTKERKDTMATRINLSSSINIPLKWALVSAYFGGVPWRRIIDIWNSRQKADNFLSAQGRSPYRIPYPILSMDKNFNIDYKTSNDYTDKEKMLVRVLGCNGCSDNLVSMGLTATLTQKSEDEDIIKRLGAGRFQGLPILSGENAHLFADTVDELQIHFDAETRERLREYKKSQKAKKTALSLLKKFAPKEIPPESDLTRNEAYRFLTTGSRGREEDGLLPFSQIQHNQSPFTSRQASFISFMDTWEGNGVEAAMWLLKYPTERLQKAWKTLRRSGDVGNTCNCRIVLSKEGEVNVREITNEVEIVKRKLLLSLIGYEGRLKPLGSGEGINSVISKIPYEELLAVIHAERGNPPYSEGRLRTIATRYKKAIVGRCRRQEFLNPAIENFGREECSNYNSILGQQEGLYRFMNEAVTDDLLNVVKEKSLDTKHGLLIATKASQARCQYPEGIDPSWKYGERTNTPYQQVIALRVASGKLAFFSKSMRVCELFSTPAKYDFHSNAFFNNHSYMCVGASALGFTKGEIQSWISILFSKNIVLVIPDEHWDILSPLLKKGIALWPQTIVQRGFDYYSLPFLNYGVIDPCFGDISHGPRYRGVRENAIQPGMAELRSVASFNSDALNTGIGGIILPKPWITKSLKLMVEKTIKLKDVPLAISLLSKTIIKTIGFPCLKWNDKVGKNLSLDICLPVKKDDKWEWVVKNENICLPNLDIVLKVNLFDIWQRIRFKHDIVVLGNKIRMTAKGIMLDGDRPIHLHQVWATLIKGCYGINSDNQICTKRGSKDKDLTDYWVVKRHGRYTAKTPKPYEIILDE